LAQGEIELDPAVRPFLARLGRDIDDHPETLVALPPRLIERLQALTAGVTVDPDDPIEGDVGL
jgi:GTP cyclohydrolase I